MQARHFIEHPTSVFDISSSLCEDSVFLRGDKETKCHPPHIMSREVLPLDLALLLLTSFTCLCVLAGSSL
jgi:hypothetical protein